MDICMELTDNGMGTESLIINEEKRIGKNENERVQVAATPAQLSRDCRKRRRSRRG